MKIVIVGGVAGGATTAARLRRNDENAEIIMFERGEYISYANCGLPYYIGGTIQDRDRLFVQTPEKFHDTFNIDVRIKSEVIAIDRDNKQVTVQDKDSGNQYTESYDKLVLSPGAEPVRPPIPGVKSPGIFTLRNVHDTDGIKFFLEKYQPKRVVIVGAGFIGLEVAENLHDQGIFVTIVEMADQVMNILDTEMAAEVHQHLKTKNVEFYLKDGVSSFSQKDEGLVVTLKSGREISADMALLSIGVRPENKLAKDAGIEIGKTNGIVVNKQLQTNDPDIYALGDVIESENPLSGTTGVIPLAGPANKQGRIVADNIAFGNKRTYSGTIATGIAKVFDLTVASTGLSEKLLKRMEKQYQAIITHSSSHAGYYPGAIPMSVKTLFDPESGKLLGAQIVGYDGVDKRIDLFAAMLGKDGTIWDLQEIEHAYAPPYSSAKDPVNIAGFVAENIITGRSEHIQWHELLQRNRDSVFLIDVRTPEEYEIDTIAGAKNIPLQSLRDNLNSVLKDKEVVVFCGVGLRAYLAERVLRQHGFSNVKNLSGGFKTYSMATEKQSNEDIFSGDYVGTDDIIYQGTPAASASALKVETVKVDASGLQCPGPIMKLKTEIQDLPEGSVIEETATDPGFGRDVESWCRMTGNKLVSVKTEGAKVTAVIEKQSKKKNVPQETGPQNGTSLVVFSDELDKALASFVIANGAASAGKEVTMFFTFWGLNVIKKLKRRRVKKDLLGKMFGFMLPASSKKLKLSKMHMGGMGTGMMRGRMKSLNINSLEEMIQAAVENGVKLVGCQMSMDVMGVKKEELMDEVEIGGVATFLESGDRSQASLFI
ncbi:MAG: CoA-disulfide reductase [Spirochaetia bacterium]